MEWHDQNTDILLLQELETNLQEFQRLKHHKWEKVVEKVQMENRLGTPSEDWIIPPDEEKERQLLEQDANYIKLRSAIQAEVSLVKRCANFLDYNDHHKLDWIDFEDPLIGNDALEDGITEVRKLQDHCRNSWYFSQNLKQGFVSLYKSLFS